MTQTMEMFLQDVTRELEAMEQTADTVDMKNSPKTNQDIKQLDALRRTHAMTVAMLEHANAQLAEQNARIQQLESLAVTDELTGLQNRRGFDSAVIAEIDRIQRGQTPSGVLCLLDLDKFKPINDTYGHHVGDLCLKAVAKCLQSSIRRTDFSGRLGGDEFAFFLTNTDRDLAAIKLADIDAQLNNIIVKHNGDSIRLGLSLGHVIINKNVKSYKQAYNIADAEMYRVKNENRDPSYQRDKIMAASEYTVA